MARNRYFEDESFHETKQSRQALKRTFSFAKPYWKRFVLGIIFALIGMAAILIRPLYDKLLVDELIPRGDVNVIVIFAVGLGLLMLIEAFFNTMRNRVLVHAGYDIVYDIRKKIFDHLQSLGFDYYDSRPAGKIFVRVTSYVNALASLLSTGLVTMALDVLQLIVIVILMLALSPTLTLISFSVCVPLILFIVLFRKTMRFKWRDMNNKVSNSNAYMSENITGVSTIQSYCREEINKSIFKEIQNKIYTRWLNLNVYNGLFMPLIDLMGNTGSTIMYLVGFVLVAGDSIPLGTLLAFAGYLARFWQPINNISNVYNQVILTMSNAERIFETIDTPATIVDAEGAYPLPEVEGEVEFDHVDFAYEGDNYILRDVSFKVKKGQSIALVGPTGAGKSTVVNLIDRFYDVSGGRVLIDGHDVKEVTMSSLRTQVGVMMQDSFIFAGTIIDNIRYGRLDATDEECIAAAKTVYADEFIMRMQDGYYTVMQERGTSLSAGEKQLLSFARIVLANPKIIILDEATSNIDTHTELLIQKAVDELLEGRTSFVIAHRLSTIKRSDCIMYVADQGIAEAGTHEELMARGGKYYSLYQSQFKESA